MALRVTQRRRPLLNVVRGKVDLESLVRLLMLQLVGGVLQAIRRGVAGQTTEGAAIGVVAVLKSDVGLLLHDLGTLLR